MKFSFKMEGLKELDAALAEFRPMTGRNILRRAGTQAMEPVADEMEAKAPKGQGDLKVAIDTGTKRGKSVQREFRDPHVVEIYAGPSVVEGGVVTQELLDQMNAIGQAAERRSNQWAASNVPGLAQSQTAKQQQHAVGRRRR